MRLRRYYPEDSEDAVEVARMFAYLYDKGIPCWVARDLASDHFFVKKKLKSYVQRKIKETQV